MCSCLAGNKSCAGWDSYLAWAGRHPVASIFGFKMISKQLFGPTLFRLSQVVLCLGFVRRCQCLLFRDRTPPWSYCFPILPCLLKKVAVQKGRGCQLLHHFLLFIFEAGGLLASVGCILPGSTLYLQRPTASKKLGFPSTPFPHPGCCSSSVFLHSLPGNACAHKGSSIPFSVDSMVLGSHDLFSPKLAPAVRSHLLGL